MNCRVVSFRPSAAHGMVSLPLSKSIGIRALLLNSLCVRPASLHRVPDCDDCRSLVRALSLIDAGGSRICLDMGAGAAPFRFVLAVVASMPGMVVEMRADSSLSRRPVAPLVDALRSIGADIVYMDDEGHPPLLVRGRSLEGGSVSLCGGVSSQFISALMMMAPRCRRGLEINIEGEAVSWPYIEMTAGVMRRFGVEPSLSVGRVVVPAGSYAAPEGFEIEPDWSAASYIYERALLGAPSPVEVAALSSPLHSLQGDAVCENIFRTLGVETVWLADGSARLECDPGVAARIRGSGVVMELDMGAAPDLVPALAVALCGAGVPFRLSGVAHLHHKECDRMVALVEQLGRLGYAVGSDGDALFWNGRGCATDEGVVAEVYGDHRMAMALAPLACRLGCVAIASPEVVAKSFPLFWDEMAKTGLISEEIRY